MVSEHLFDRACADLHEMRIRAEAAEAELARVKASGIESMRRAEAAEKERDKADATFMAAQGKPLA